MSYYFLILCAFEYFLLVRIHNGLMDICNGFFTTLKSDSHYWTLTLRIAAEKKFPLDLDNVISELG